VSDLADRVAVGWGFNGTKRKKGGKSLIDKLKKEGVGNAEKALSRGRNSVQEKNLRARRPAIRNVSKEKKQTKGRRGKWVGGRKREKGHTTDCSL